MRLDTLLNALVGGTQVPQAPSAVPRGFEDVFAVCWGEGPSPPKGGTPPPVLATGAEEASPIQPNAAGPTPDLLPIDPFPLGERDPPPELDVVPSTPQLRWAPFEVTQPMALAAPPSTHEAPSRPLLAPAPIIPSAHTGPVVIGVHWMKVAAAIPKHAPDSAQVGTHTEVTSISTLADTPLDGMPEALNPAKKVALVECRLLGDLRLTQFDARAPGPSVAEMLAARREPMQAVMQLMATPSLQPVSTADGKPPLPTQIAATTESTAPTIKAESRLDVKQSPLAPPTQAVAAAAPDMDAFLADSRSDSALTEKMLTPSPASRQDAPITVPEVVQLARAEAPERPLNSAEVPKAAIRQVVDRIESLAAHRPRGTIVVRLDPPELGTITLTVHQFGPRLDADVSTTNDALRTALEQNRGQLGLALEQRGLTPGTIRFDAPMMESSLGQPHHQGTHDPTPRQEAPRPGVTLRDDLPDPAWAPPTTAGLDMRL